ncbi:MAG: hypothetical protein LBU03_06705 [Tannerellaceae bacterium]|jgi:hypothetical protein|nr:hypothetical protein [Tannerellaceae bacterium]
MVWRYLWVLSGLSLSLMGFAETYHVAAKKGDDVAAGTSWKEPLRSLGEALNRAGSGDVILLTVGTYYTGLSSFHINDNLTLIGGYTGEESEGAEPTNQAFRTILKPSYDIRCRVFLIGSYENPNIQVLIRNLTITGGDATGDTLARCGGGIYNYADTELRDVEVRDNKASFGEEEGRGGGIYNCLGRLTLTGNSVVAYNVAGSSGIAAGWGGGIYNEGGNLVISETVSVSDNIASLYGGVGFGGGIYNEGTLRLEGQVTIRANIACKAGTGGVVPSEEEAFGGFGGGILNHGENAETLIYGGTISENYAVADVGNGLPAYGGGIHNEDGGKLSVFFPSIIRDNVATAGIGDGHGGGISSVRGGSKLTVTGTVERNTAVLNAFAHSNGYGGGIYCGKADGSEASFMTAEGSAVIYNNMATTGRGEAIGNGVYPPNLTHTVTLKSTPYFSLNYGSGNYEVSDGDDFDVMAYLHIGSLSSVGKAAIIVNGESLPVDKGTTGPITVPGLQNIREDKIVDVGIFVSVSIKSADFVETELPVGKYEVYAEEPFEFNFTVAEGHRDLIRVNVNGKFYEPDMLGDGRYRCLVSLTKENTSISPVSAFTLSFLECPANVSLFLHGQSLNLAEPLAVAAGENPYIEILYTGRPISGQLKAYVNGRPTNLFPTEKSGIFELSLGTVVGNMEVQLVMENLAVTPSPRLTETQFTTSAQGVKVEMSDVRTVSIYTLTGELKVKRIVCGTAFVPLTKGIYIIEIGGKVSRVIVH